MSTEQLPLTPVPKKYTADVIDTMDSVDEFLETSGDTTTTGLNSGNKLVTSKTEVDTSEGKVHIKSESEFDTSTPPKLVSRRVESSVTQRGVSTHHVVFELSDEGLKSSPPTEPGNNETHRPLTVRNMRRNIIAAGGQSRPVPKKRTLYTVLI